MTKAHLCSLSFAFAVLAATSASVWAGPINVAASANGGSASQSSYYGGASTFGPGFAIDGNTDGYRYGNTATLQHTGNEPNAWWEVMFNADYLLSSVTIYNRLDCCSSRINPFSVFLLDSGGNVIGTVATGQSFAGGQVSWTQAISNVVAHGLKVQLDGTNYLHMAQVQVMGDTGGVPEPASMAMTGLGALGVAVLLRRRQSRSH